LIQSLNAPFNALSFTSDIGKAGHHLRLGAAIPYNGREIEVNKPSMAEHDSYIGTSQVSTYEVLVPALQPMRYAISDTLQIPEIPRMLREQNHEVEGLQRLK
jgi:hypothetical protein